jgi:hypothetical protein
MIVALTGGAVVLAGFGLGMAASTRELPGSPIATPDAVSGGMQPGTLPTAALAGPSTTTVAPPPTTPAQSTTAPPTSAHTAAPPPIGQNPPAVTLPEPGQSCGSPGQFSFDAEYQPIECVVDPTTGAATWQQFSGARGF